MVAYSLSQNVNTNYDFPHTAQVPQYRQSSFGGPADMAAERAWNPGYLEGQNALNREYAFKPLDLQQQALNFRQSAFDRLFPSVQGLFAKFGQGAGAGAGGGPQINAGPIYTPQQIQQQVNTGVGANNAQFGGLLRNLMSKFGSSGMSPNSGLLAGLQARLGAQNAAANTGVRTSVPFQFAADNARQLLSGQMAQETQYRNRQNEALGAQQNAMQALAALLGFVG